MFTTGLSLPRGTAGALIALSIANHVTVAAAHDAPSGWIYPVSCCSDYDCREVADANILERPEGYVIKATGETLAMTDYRVRPSPDGRYHWCSVKGRPDGWTICLFVPPRAS